MSEQAKILVVAEGEKRERPFLQQAFKLYGVNADLYVFHANIYNLYRAMEELDFCGDLRDVLGTLPCMKNQDLKTLQETRFAYTYLIFDCDAQHTMDEKKDKFRLIDETVQVNFQRLSKMVAYFTNETDPAVGKLYVNYPMMESYRDCENFFDENYRYTQVCIDDIGQYKAITGKRKLANVRIDKFSKENFSDLLRMNVYKLNSMLGDGWENLTYAKYQILSEQRKIAAYQQNLTAGTRNMDVLNTTLFLLADYYGNRDGFYSTVMAGTASKEQTQQELSLVT